jgi:hypothetical protein
MMTSETPTTTSAVLMSKGYAGLLARLQVNRAPGRGIWELVMLAVPWPLTDAGAQSVCQTGAQPDETDGPPAAHTATAHGVSVSRSRTSSGWRCVSVLSNTCWRWVRTVANVIDKASAISLRLVPRETRSATSASVVVRL